MQARTTETRAARRCKQIVVIHTLYVCIIIVLIIMIIIIIIMCIIIMVLCLHKYCLHFSMCACHPCTGAMLIFSVSFQV